MKWGLSDGTTVYLGGRVRGDSLLADRLREDVVLLKSGHGVSVQVDIHPSAPQRVDLGSPQLVNEWVAWRAGRSGVRVTSAPELDPIERNNPPEPDEASSTTIY